MRHFPAFCARIPGRSLFALSSEKLDRLGGFGCIFYILYKKAPDNIAAFRLKIGRSQVPLQPFKLMGCWNLDRLLWQPWRRRHTFGLVCLARQKWMLKLDFFANVRIYGRAYTHISAELFMLQIGRFKKKLRRSEDTSISRFLRTHTWEEPSHIIIWKPG